MSNGREQHAEQLLRAVNDAAAAVSSRFVTFVSVGAYVAVTVASTTHEMLLRASSMVTLPLLNAQIPIIGPFGFYSVAPWLVVLLHSDLLLQLSILSNELDRFDQEASALPAEPQSLLRQRVANFYYVLYLTAQAPSRFLHLLSAFITWVTTVVLPLGLLLWIQIRFLPFHSPLNTWMHRAALFADVALILFVLMPHLWSRWHVTGDVPGSRTLLRRALSVPTLVLAACAVTAFVSLFVAVIPGDTEGNASWFAQNMELRERVLTANVLTPEDVNELRDSPPDRLKIVLSKVTPYQALQGRDFRYADLYNAVLPKLDLRAVRPQGVSAVLPEDCEARRGCEDPPECIDTTLERTRMAGANFGWASMQQAMFDDAILDGADLSWAKVQYGSFSRATMNGANLKSARVTAAHFDGTKLCGANLSEAQMQNASFVGAHLRGATLRSADLANANLEGADLRGADLSSANLTGAVLRKALLKGAILRGAAMDGIKMDGATIELTEVTAAKGDSNDSSNATVAYLVELACDDRATARGIVAQALGSPARDRPALARELLSARDRPDCKGMGEIPKEDIEALAVRSEAKTAGR
ncbi:MAG TPA: pentapeptide repeat-containing protein [Candidatus Limnocylindrales bacterium]|nr:pentapeptide repeat-containing protein [Candidatus Limnocylindrales bacterium]